MGVRPRGNNLVYFLAHSSSFILNCLCAHVNCSMYGHWKWISGIKGNEVKKKTWMFWCDNNWFISLRDLKFCAGHTTKNANMKWSSEAWNRTTLGLTLIYYVNNTNNTTAQEKIRLLHIWLALLRRCLFHFGARKYIIFKNFVPFNVLCIFHGGGRRHFFDCSTACVVWNMYEIHIVLRL